VDREGTVAVHDVSYLSDGRRVAGYLLEPEGAEHAAGIVLVHGSGGDRGELLGDALDLAKRGVVAMTITEPSSAHPPPTPTSAGQLLSESLETTREDVVAIRRAADALQSLDAVDPRKLGYLGWSAGAKTGAFVAASDPRFRALALLSGGADPVSAFVAAAPVSIRRRVRTVLGSVDPLRYLGYARPGTILLEDGTRDTVVPHEALENFVHAAPPRTLVHWYRAGHALTTAAYTTAFDWLIRKLS
jgi:dienelactone hydrolase